jgi:hypothetical protein
MSTEMCSMIYEFLINAEECQINATSVIYLGMKEDRSVTEEMLKEIVGGAVRRASDNFMESSSRLDRISKIMSQVS